MMKTHPSLIAIAVGLPFILWAVGGILPTFDDYTSLQSTWWVRVAEPGYFFADAVRRPFDALLGYVVGTYPQLFPTLNHVLIVVGHAASACLVFAVCRQLSFSTLATNMATLFFFLSPATLGATLACDGFNQTYAQLWGLLALWLYLRGQWAWLLCIVMAALSKENGLAWAVVPPVIAFAFGKAEWEQALRHTACGLAVAAGYLMVFFVVYHSGIVHVEYADEYTSASLLSHLKDFVQLMAYTWFPVDYVSVVYPPSRNMAVAIVTALLPLPFLLLMASKWKLALTRQLLLLMACFLVLVAPHLLTLVSIMHNYAALSMAALIVAFLTHHIASKKALTASFALFMAAALFTDIHHCMAARQSGELGRRLALQAIQQAGKTPQQTGKTPQQAEKIPQRAEKIPQRAMVINIDRPEEPRYSSFCVRPVDAFAWGLSVYYYTNYQWHTAISELTLDHYDPEQTAALADSALSSGCDVVWVAGHNQDHLQIFSKTK